MMSRLSFRGFSAPICLAALGTTPAAAATIVGTFTGVVDSVDGDLSGTFSARSDTSRAPIASTPRPRPRATSNSTFAVFNALTGLQFQIGGYSASSIDARESRSITTRRRPG